MLHQEPTSFNAEKLRKKIGEGRTLQEVADLAEMKRPYLSRMLNGEIKNPTVAMLDKLAGVLKCKARDFLD